ncbi:hypothetical protein K523DRAFT_359146 [Schizophyllum commune Tattone D]|nr:hypothetical protein K523DRAFT_359146 [Schizophyllum commune Tattone D]
MEGVPKTNTLRERGAFTGRRSFKRAGAKCQRIIWKPARSSGRFHADGAFQMQSLTTSARSSA